MTSWNWANTSALAFPQFVRDSDRDADAKHGGYLLAKASERRTVAGEPASCAAHAYEHRQATLPGHSQRPRPPLGSSACVPVFNPNRLRVYIGDISTAAKCSRPPGVGIKSDMYLMSESGWYACGCWLRLGSASSPGGSGQPMPVSPELLRRVGSRARSHRDGAAF